MNLAHPRDWSLRLRLIVFFSVFLLLAWAAATLFAWQESRKHIDRFFDTQQLLFASTLAEADFDQPEGRLPKPKEALRGVKKKEQGRQDKNALGFAVFGMDGSMLLSDGEKGGDFVFDPGARGFENSHLRRKRELWRLVWVPSPDGARLVAVGQELKYRERMAYKMLAEQLMPWLLLFPVLLSGLLWMLGRELAPLKKVAATLEARSPDDSSSLTTHGVPPEVRPLVESLNSLFRRVAGLIARERSFIADAAHELRTPLTGLRVQAEVIGLSDDDPAARKQAISNLLEGIDRCGRLVEQLLTLSRLEGCSGDAAPEVPDWPLILGEVISEYRARIEQKNLDLSLDFSRTPASRPGNPQLLGILVRNLVDNAVKYSPENGWLRVTLDERSFRIENSGNGVSDECLSRLSERFFRPPGQTESGSGLGLSIAKHIAEKHEMRLVLGNIEGSSGASGFVARLMFK